MEHGTTVHDPTALARAFLALADGAPPVPRAQDARSSSDPATRWPQLVRGPEPLPRRVPARLAALVCRCLARDPGERPAAAEVAVELEPLVAALPRPRGLASDA